MNYAVFSYITYIASLIGFGLASQLFLLRELIHISRYTSWDNLRSSIWAMFDYNILLKQMIWNLLTSTDWVYVFFIFSQTVIYKKIRRGVLDKKLLFLVPLKIKSRQYLTAKVTNWFEIFLYEFMSRVMSF